MHKYLDRPLSLTGQFSFCSLPIRLDSYRGCSFSCPYCFARTRGGNVPKPQIVPARPSALDNIFTRLDRYSENVGLIGEFLRRRSPIHFGGMSDPFQPAELRHQITLKYLQTLCDRSYPVVISSKGLLAGVEPYLSILRGGRFPVVVQFSLSTTEDSLARSIEPHATRPSILLRTMETLASAGVIVACRWQPYIMTVAEKPSTYVRRVAATGARHLAIEHLKIPVEQTSSESVANRSPVIAEAWKVYQSLGAIRDGREFILPAIRKLDRVLHIRSLCHKFGMTFGAADNEFLYLSDGHACCSGVDAFPGF